MKQKFYVAQPAWESIQPILEQNRIKDHGRFKIVGARTVRTIAEEGIGIGLQAESIIPKDTEAYFKYPVKPQINTDFVLIANKFDDLSPAVKAFIETMRENESKPLMKAEQAVRWYNVAKPLTQGDKFWLAEEFEPMDIGF